MPNPRYVLRNCATGETFAHVLTGRRETLFDALDRNAIDIENSCDGSVSCGRCVVVVLEGAEHLPAPKQDELDLLERFAPDEPRARLACRLERPSGDETVEVCTSYWER